MDVSVLETFIDKFKYLWQSGQDATLTEERRAGQAWIWLEVQLGQAPGHFTIDKYTLEHIVTAQCDEDDENDKL